MIKNKQIRILLVMVVACMNYSCSYEKEKVKKPEEIVVTSKEEIVSKKVLRHVVLFKFKDETNQEDVNKLNEAFIALPESIPAITDFEWGLNDSPENFHQGFTHCYLVTFSSEKDRDEIYTPHPKHKEFVASLQPHLEKVFVVDYWTNP